MNWHGKVYKRKRIDMPYTDEWHKLRTACFKRDKYTCQRCEVHNTQGRGLNAHHLIPRSEDGADEIYNLITLCEDCHNYVEVNNLRTKVDIIGSYATPDYVAVKEKVENKTDEGYHFTRPD